MIRSLMLCLLMASVVQAEPPRAVVTGPKSGSAGDIIRLDISKSIGKVFKVKVKPEMFDDGRPTMDLDDPMRPLIASRPGRYDVLVIAANDEGIDDIEFTVTIGGTIPQPGPGPQPNPNPNPNPTPQPSKYGLTEFVRSLPTAALTTPDAMRSRLRVNYAAVASQLAAGTLSGVGACNTELKRRYWLELDAATGNQWKDAVIDPIDKKLWELLKARKIDLGNNSDLQALYSEISNGFGGP